MQLLQPHPGWVELDPLILWEQFVDVIAEVIEGTQTSQSAMILLINVPTISQYVLFNIMRNLNIIQSLK